MVVLKILILFLIIQTSYKFVICGDLDHDYYYSMEEVSEGPDVTTKMPADNEMTHVRSKNLSGNIKLTTLEILPTITPFDGLNNESGNDENGISDGATNEFVSINKNKQDGIQTIGENQQLTSLSEVTTKVPTDGTLGPYTVMNVFSNTSGITATEKPITVMTLQPKIIDQDMTSTTSYFDLFNFGDDKFDKIEPNEAISSDDEKIAFGEKIEEVSSTPTIFNLLSPQYSEEIEETSSYTSVTEATGPVNQNSEDVEDISSFLEVDEDFLKSVPNDTILDQSIEDMSNILDFEIIENELDVINIKENNETEHEISDKNKDTGITTEEDFISADTDFFTDKESEDTSSIETFYEDTLNFDDKNNVTTTEKTEDGENDHSLNEASVEVENEETTVINVKSNKKGLEYQNEATEDISSIVTENYASTKTEKTEEIFVRNEDTTVVTETKNFTDDVSDNPVSWNEFNDLEKETEDLDLEDKNEATEEISSIVTENYANTKTERTEEIPVKNEDTTIATTLATEAKNFFDDVTDKPLNWNEFNDLQKETEDLEDKNEAIEDISSIVTENYANNKIETTEEIPVKNEDTKITTTLATETKNFTDDVTENPVNWNEFNDLQKETKDLEDKNEATENYANTKTEKTKEIPVRSEDTTMGVTLATETNNFTDDVTHKTHSWNEFSDLQKATNNLEEQNEAIEDISSTVTENFHVSAKIEKTEEIPNRNEDTTITAILATETKNFTDDVTNNAVNWNEFSDLQKATEDFSSNFILKENSTIIIVNEASTVASNTSTKNEENTNLTEIFREIEDERKKSSEESIKFINEDEMTTTDMKILTENFLYSTEENKQTTITDNEITEETFQNNRDKSQDDEDDKYEETTDKNLNKNEENPTTINKEEEIVKNDLLMEKYDTFAVTTAQITEWNTENFSDKDNVELASSTKTNLLSKSIKKTEEIDREQNFNKVTSPPNHHKTNLVTKTQDIKLDNFVTPFHPNENKFNLTTAEMLTTEEIKTMETKEPQISGNISGKQIHFSVKIIDQDANFFIPSDASITFPTPDSINITWKSTSEKFNNSLGFYQNSIQLNIVKSNRMHIHKTRFISNTQNKSEDIDTQLITLDNGIQIRFSSLDFLKAKFGTTNQNKALAAEIMGGCVGVSVITGVVVYYVMKKYKGKTRNFKPNSEA